MDFELERALRLAAFFVGMFLHGTLVLGLLGRSDARPSDRVLRIFFVAILLWHGGSFFALLMQNALGPGASLVRRAANILAFTGLAFLPSLLLHTVVRVARERRATAAVALWERLLVWVSYLPLVGLPWPLWMICRPPERPPLTALEAFVVPWTAWFVVVNVVAAGLSLWIGSQNTEDSPRLDLRLAPTFLLAAAGLAYVYVFDGRSGPYGYTLETLVMASSIAPTLVFVYFVYRYRVLGYAVRDRAVTLFASASFVAFYLFFVPSAARTAAGPTGMPAQVFEGFVLVVLVLLFQPYGDTLRGLARRYFAGGQERLHRSAARCAALLAQARDVDQIAAAFRSSLDGREILHARLLLDADLQTGSPEVRRLRHAAPRVVAELDRGTDLVRREEVRGSEILGELHELEADAVFALRSKGRLYGALAVAGYAPGLGIGELEALDVVAQGAALALASAALQGEKLSAERMAAQAEKMASLGWLAASVAHEVKNPLSSIKAVAQVLRQEAEDGHPWQPDLELIVREADRLDGAVERLLRNARPADDGRGDGPVELAAVLDRMKLAIEPQAHAQGVLIQFQLMHGASRVTGSVDALWEVLYNLATNAIDAMPGGGTLRFEQLAGGAPDRMLLRVSDDGPGIPSDVRARVFEPFFTTKQSGHGLGLAIVRRRIREMGGDITLVDQETTGGTAFELELPAAE